MAHNELDPTKRFSNRVEDYVKYRPGYPGQLIDLLRKEARLSRDSVVADVGSGTGKLSLLFLENGNRVYGLEPNDEMRAAGERLLAGYSQFISINALAEATSLPDASVDFIVAGQAFHWFDPELAKVEFARILKSSGSVVLIWNDWSRVPSPVNRAYVRLIQRYGSDYERVEHTKSSNTESIRQFFNPRTFQEHYFENYQIFGYEGLQGRLLSSSYAVTADHPNYGPMLAELRQIFDTFQVDGQVRFDYDTKVFLGRLSD